MVSGTTSLANFRGERRSSLTVVTGLLEVEDALDAVSARRGVLSLRHPDCTAA